MPSHDVPNSDENLERSTKSSGRDNPTLEDSLQDLCSSPDQSEDKDSSSSTGPSSPATTLSLEATAPTYEKTAQVPYPYLSKDPEGSLKGDDSNQGSREQWGAKLNYILACIGSCVGLGNLWRFPYLAYKSGGGAFLIPYFVMLFLCGIPLLLMEMAIGQYTRRGPVGALGKLCPFFIGSAIGVVVISTVFCSYYNIIISWSLYYMFQSFRGALPWVVCPSNATADGPLCMPNDTSSPTEYYYNEYVLQKSQGFEDFGAPVPSLLGCDVLAWIVVYFAIFKSVKSSGNMVLVTATVPFVFIFIFLYKTLNLEGAVDGLEFLFSPKWELLLDPKVWVNAAAQNFNSIGIGFGAMITFSSYNDFKNNLLCDVWTISIVNCVTSLLAGMIVFSTLGNIAFETGKNITDVVAEGPGLAFIVYPQALAQMGYPNAMSFLFFALLFMLGIDSQFATVEVIVTSIKDSYPEIIDKYLKRHEVLALLVCVVCFLLGLPNICNGGIYYFSILDHYSASISLMLLAFFEVVGVVWIYGVDQLSKDIKHMTGKFPSSYFKLCWRFISPLLIVIICIFSWIGYTRPTYDSGKFTFPDWTIAFGWFVALSSVIPIPIAGSYVIYNAEGDSFSEKLRNAFRSKLPEYCHYCYPSDCSCNNDTYKKQLQSAYQLSDLSPHKSDAV